MWRCDHPKIAQYLSNAIAACKQSIEDGKLNRVSLCFFDGHRKSDEVCVHLASFPIVDVKDAPALHNWFRESLLVLESRVKGADPASSFQVELVCVGQMTKNTDWLLAEDRSDGSQVPAAVESVRPMGEMVPVEVFVKRFMR